MRGFYQGGFNYFDVQKYRTNAQGQTANAAEIQDAINDCFSKGGGTVYFPNGVYPIENAPVTSTHQGVNPNSQLYIPYDIFNATNQVESKKRRTIKFIGESAPNPITTQYFQTGQAEYDNAEPATSGVVLQSTYNNTSAIDPTVLTPSVIGTSGPDDGFIYGSWNMIGVQFENLTVRTHVDPALNYAKMNGINMAFAQSAILNNVLVDVDVRNITLAEQLDWTYGIVMPKISCDLVNQINNCRVNGYRGGFLTSEHTQILKAIAFTCKSALVVGLATHIMNVLDFRPHGCKHQITALEQTLWGFYQAGRANINVAMLNNERSPAGYIPAAYNQDADILDPSNNLHGEVVYWNVTAGGAIENNLFTKSGGVNLKTRALGGSFVVS